MGVYGPKGAVDRKSLGTTDVDSYMKHSFVYKRNRICMYSISGAAYVLNESWNVAVSSSGYVITNVMMAEMEKYAEDGNRNLVTANMKDKA